MYYVEKCKIIDYNGYKADCRVLLVTPQALLTKEKEDVHEKYGLRINMCYLVKGQRE